MNIYKLIVNLIIFALVIAAVIRPLKINFPSKWRYIGNKTLTIGLGLSPLLGVTLLLIIQGISGKDAGSIFSEHFNFQSEWNCWKRSHSTLGHCNYFLHTCVSLHIIGPYRSFRIYRSKGY